MSWLGKAWFYSQNSGVLFSEVDNIKQAYNAFKLEYDALPGDMANASIYWPGASNGNGDRKIDIELFLAWRHLTLSGIYPGSYTGIGSVPAVAGVNVPTTPFGANYGKNSYWVIHRHSGFNAIYGKTAHSINLNSYSSLVNAWGAVVTTTQAYSIDQKIDDGLANKGLIYTAKGREYEWQNNICTLGTNNYHHPSAAYNLADTSTTPHCWMFFWLE